MQNVIQEELEEMEDKKYLVVEYITVKKMITNQIKKIE